MQGLQYEAIHGIGWSKAGSSSDTQSGREIYWRVYEVMSRPLYEIIGGFRTYTEGELLFRSEKNPVLIPVGPAAPEGLFYIQAFTRPTSGIYPTSPLLP